jgi:hypothetical protein
VGVSGKKFGNCVGVDEFQRLKSMKMWRSEVSDF